MIQAFGAIIGLWGIWLILWDKPNPYVPWLVGAALALLVIGHFVSPAAAHDHNRPDLKPWFEGLRSRARAPCCDGSDATRLDDVDWESNAGGYRVRIGGKWIPVPKDAVVDGPNLAGTAMVWPVEGYGGLTIRCFMPGSMT